MYTPASFEISDRTLLYAAVERYSFALLVSASDGEPQASHLPLLLDRDRGTHGTLLGHMARANPHWQVAAGQNVLAVFAGPHAYVSPRWYAADRVVPTWNYIAVHAYGRLELIDDLEQTVALLKRTVDHYEASLPEPWPLDAPAEFLAGLARQVVAFQIPIGRLEGKWKLNQNHAPDRRQRVAAALERQGGEDALELARLMRQDL
jgi:transcriptional regulator